MPHPTKDYPRSPPPLELIRAQQVIVDAINLLTYDETLTLANKIKNASSSVLLNSIVPKENL